MEACIIEAYISIVYVYNNMEKKHSTKHTLTHLECVAESVEQVMVGLHFIPVQLPGTGGADQQRQAIQHTLTHSICTQSPTHRPA